MQFVEPLIKNIPSSPLEEDSHAMVGATIFAVNLWQRQWRYLCLRMRSYCRDGRTWLRETVGTTDVTKNGVDLLEDAAGDDPGDRYDDTHALLRNGLVDGLTMKNLTIDVGETYDDPQFAGSGPMDNLYVDGDVSGFADATKEGETYGSDHFPVWTILSRQVVRSLCH